MVTRQTKKKVKQRGSKTHGWGAMKKHRGKGNKGGAGMAGTGKRGDAKKPCIWSQDYFGKKGFKKKNALQQKTINVGELDQKIDKLVILKKIEQKGDQFRIDLSKIGINKLLSKGKATKKMNINVLAATEKATKKISEAGGQVKLPTEAPAEPEVTKKQPAQE
jgi:large subunit ribosomal protein L15